MLSYFSIQLLTFISNCLLGSCRSCLNELLSLWCLIFCTWSVFSKTTNAEPLSCTLIVWLFHDFISFNAFCSRVEMFGRVKTYDFGLNKSFSLLSMNNSRLRLFVGFELYRGPQCLPCLGGGGSTVSSRWFWSCMGYESSWWSLWFWLKRDCFKSNRSWFTNFVKSLRNL